MMLNVQYCLLGNVFGYKNEQNIQLCPSFPCEYLLAIITITDSVSMVIPIITCQEFKQYVTIINCWKEKRKDPSLMLLS